MGNAAGKEFKEKELGTVSLHEEGKNSFAPSMVTTTATTLIGKTSFSGTPGYMYSKEDDKKMLFLTQAEGSLGRKGSIHDGDKNLLAHVRVEHSMKSGVLTFYKTEPSYDGQASAKVDDMDLYVFAKIETSRKADDIHSTYSVVTGGGDSGETFEPLYKAKRVIGMRFMTLVETNDGVAVGKISNVFGPPKLKLEVASGVDLAAVILTGEGTAPNGDSVAQLPGASFM